MDNGDPMLIAAVTPRYNTMPCDTRRRTHNPI